MDKHDLTRLEGQIKELGGTLISLADDRDFQEFITIIHRPGWTTVAEYSFVTGVVDSMLAQAKTLVGLKQVLVNGSSRSDRQVTVSGGCLPACYERSRRCRRWRDNARAEGSEFR
jgi:hypothetical protein